MGGVNKSITLIFTFLIIIFVLFSINSFADEMGWYSGFITTITAIIGVAVVAYQMRREKDINEATFFIELYKCSCSTAILE